MFFIYLFVIFILKVFRGNRDGNTVMKHYLKEKLVAKTLRILRHQNSKDFMGSTVCLRAEVYGCEFQTGECRLSWDTLLMLETDRKCPRVADHSDLYHTKVCFFVNNKRYF